MPEESLNPPQNSSEISRSQELFPNSVSSFINKKKFFLLGFLLVIFLILGGLYFFKPRKVQAPEKPLTLTERAEEPEKASPVPKEVPASYQIEDVPYYGEKNFCYGASTMMVLGQAGFDAVRILEFREYVKREGKGGPPDIFIGFKEYELEDQVRLGYSTEHNESFAQFYDGFLNAPDEQVALFENQEAALEKLKELVSSDITVIVLIDNGNHYVVVTGYDEEFIYINDPNPDVKERTVSVSEILSEWQNYEQELDGNMGFPGELGMIWLER